MRFFTSIWEFFSRSRQPRTYILSERLGRGKEMTDWEFTCFVEGYWDELSPRRQRQLSVIFCRQPWNEHLLEARARRRLAEMQLASSR